MRMHPQEIIIRLPRWLPDKVAGLLGPEGRCPGDEEKMDLAIALAMENVEQGTGGPFAAAVFEADGGLVAAGVNLVTSHNLSSLHAEVVALSAAQTRLGSYTLRPETGPGRELFTSSEPCAMCLGASLWSGVTRIVYAAKGADAREAGFDEGPVFVESWEYMRTRGISVQGGLGRDKARAVFARYRELGGVIYNG